MSTAPHFSEICDDDRTTATGLARYAYEYIDAARLVDRDTAKKKPGLLISPVPAYFLAHHGIELTLKAYLRHKSVSVRDLRTKKFGHDLHAAAVSIHHDLHICPAVAGEAGLSVGGDGVWIDLTAAAGD